MKTPGLPRALLVVAGLALAVLAGSGTADSFGGTGSLWGDRYDPNSTTTSNAEVQETVLREPHIRATLDSMSAVFMEALENGDHETLAGLYAENAVYLPAMGRPLRGKEAVRAHLEEDLPDVSSVEVQDRSVLVLSPEWATEHATATFRMNADGTSRVTEMSYSHLYHKTDDGWRIVRDIGSSNGPPGTER